MELVHRTALRVFVTATLYALALGLAYFAYPALIAIVFSLFFAYLLEPIMKFFQHHVWQSRLGSIAFSYIVFAIAITAFLLLVGPNLGSELNTVTHKGPIYWNLIKSGQVPPALANETGVAGRFGRALVHWASRHESWVGGFAQRATQYATDVVAVVFWAVVALILGIFILKDKDRWIASLTHEPDEPSKRRRLHFMLVEIDRAMARYIWSLVILSVLAFGAFAVILSALHLPSAILLAGLQGLMEWIFVFGPLSAGILILTVAIFTGHHILLVLIFLIAWRIVQDYVNVLWLFGKRLEMNPLVVIVILMIGWSVGSALGVFLAVPIAAACQIAWETWTTHGTPAKDIAALFEEHSEK